MTSNTLVVSDIRHSDSLFVYTADGDSLNGTGSYTGAYSNKKICVLLNELIKISSHILNQVGKVNKTSTMEKHDLKNINLTNIHTKTHVAQSVSRRLPGSQAHPAWVVGDNGKKWSSYKIMQGHKTNNNSLSLLKIVIVNSSKIFLH